MNDMPYKSQSQIIKSDCFKQLWASKTTNVQQTWTVGRRVAKQTSRCIFSSSKGTSKCRGRAISTPFNFLLLGNKKQKSQADDTPDSNRHYRNTTVSYVYNIDSTIRSWLYSRFTLVLFFFENDIRIIKLNIFKEVQTFANTIWDLDDRINLLILQKGECSEYVFPTFVI